MLNVNCALRTVPIYQMNAPVVQTYKKAAPKICCTIIPPHMEKKYKHHHEQDETMGEIAKRHFEHSHFFRQKRCQHPCEHAIRAPKQEGLVLRPIPAFEVFNAENSEDLKKDKIDDPHKVADQGDQDPLNAVTNSMATYQCYLKLFNRDSVDDKGQNIDSTVHFEKEYNNAFWNGEQMVYGDGDHKVFDDFTKYLDVIAHELTHGVTQNLSNLTYELQSGALNEHLSDAFGKIVQHYVQSQSKDPSVTLDDLIGGGLLLPYEGVNYPGLRSMSNPGTAYVNHPVLGTDPQPGRMSDFKIMKNDDDDDQGGVHINSGIPNHAFWLFNEGLKEQKIGSGNLWDIPGQVWYDTAQKIKSNCDFKPFAQTTWTSVEDLKGTLAKEGVDYDKVQNILKNAWQQVEIYI